MAGSRFIDTIITFFINTQQARSQLNSFQQAFNGGISRMRNMVLGFIGAQGLKGYYDSLLRIVDVADRFHLPVDQVSAFTNVFASLGGTADEAISHIEKLQQLANNLKFHSSGALRDLGAILNVNLANKDYQGVINALRTGMAGLSNDAKTEVLNMLGSDSVAFQRMLELSNEEYAQVLERANEYGVLTEKNAQSLREMRQTLAEIKQTLLDLALPFVRAIKPILEIVRDISRWFAKLPDNVKDLVAQLIIARTVLKTLFGGFGSLIGGRLLKTLGTIGLIADGANGIYHGLKKATEEGARLQDVLDEMAAHSYTLKIAMEIGGALGKLFANWRNSRADRMAAIALEYASDPSTAFGSDINQQTSGLIRAKRWLENNPNAENYDTVLRNYKIAKAENQWYWMKRGWDIYGKPEWVGKQSPVATNDNRTMTFNIYGVDGADDLQNRLMTIINNNTNSTVGWAQ